MSERREPIETETGTTELSLAVKLVDAFTGTKPIEEPRISIDGKRTESITNPSGYRLFFDAVESPGTLRVDGTERYLSEHRDLSDRVAWPAVEIELRPAAAYDFPAGTTLIRGHVRDSERNGVKGAEVSIRGCDRSSTETTDKGEFVLFFRTITAEDVERTDGKRVVTIDGDDPTIEASHPDFGSRFRAVEVEESKTTVCELIYD